MLVISLIIFAVGGGLMSVFQIIECLRRILRDMYIGNYGRKSVQKEKELYFQQNLKNRITLSYIKPYLIKHYSVDFDYYHKFYTIYCYCVVILYAISALIGYFLGLYPLIISLTIIGIINIIIVVKLRIFEFPDGFRTHSVYWERK